MASRAIEIANKYAQQSRDRREQARRDYPKHAALTDWARAGGLEVAAVTVDGKTFGKPLPDAKPPLLMYASEIAEGLRDGRIAYAGQERVRRFRSKLAAFAKDDADL